MGASGGSQDQTTSKGIPKFIKPYVSDLLSRGKAASNQVSNQPYSGQFLAPVQTGEREGAAQQSAYGQTLGTTAGQGLVDLGNRTVRGDFLTPESNPYLMPQIQTLNDQIMRNYQDQSKRVSSNAIQGGAYGGGRAQVGQAALAGETSSAIGSNTTNLLFQNYQAERAAQERAGAMIQQGIGLNMLGPQIMQEGGAATRALDQVNLDEQIAKFNEQQAAPFRALQPYANLVYGSSPLFQNSAVSSKGGGGSSGAGGILGTVLGALSLGGTLGLGG